MNEETIEALKKYWPWALGAAAVWFLFLRGGGGESAGGTDGALLQYDLAARQIDKEISLAAINAQGRTEQAQYAYLASEVNAVMGGFESLASINNAFVQENIASYQVTKDVAISSINQAAEITKAGLQSGAQITASFHDSVATQTQSAADIVKAIAGANANTAGGGFRMLGSLAMSGF